MFPYLIGDLCRAENFETIINGSIVKHRDICLILDIKHLKYYIKFKLFNLRTQKIFEDVWNPDCYTLFAIA